MVNAVVSHEVVHMKLCSNRVAAVSHSHALTEIALSLKLGRASAQDESMVFEIAATCA